MGGGDKKGAYWILVRKPKRKRPPRRPRHKEEHNIKTDVQEMERGRTWTGLIRLSIRTSGGLL